VYAAADALVFNNRLAWAGAGCLPRTRVIANGVDLRTFRVTVAPAARAPRLLWLGSEFHRARKGYDAIVVPLCERLRADGIACDVRLVDSLGGALRSAEEMADWYNTGTVLLCASEEEGTPNVALEAAACGCTVVSTRVGNMPELIRDGWNGFLIAPDLAAADAAVRAACRDYPRLAAAMQEAIRAWDWPACCVRYHALFAELAAPGWRRDTWT
jgi:glycosyltransferase involved in cell wall biosynthesis